MMRWWRWITVMVLLGLGFGQVSAQSGPPIIILRGGDQAKNGYGDLWSYVPGQGEPFRETTWGYNSSISLSPDGSKLAYSSLPAGVVDMLAAGTYTLGSGAPDPANIWLMDIASRQFTRIADQPTPNDQSRGTDRSGPIWSPDGHKIAWGELDPDPNMFAGQVVVYDLASGETNVIAKRLGMAYADGGMFSITGVTGWGNYLTREYWTFGLPGGYQDPGTLLEFVGDNGFIRQETLAVDAVNGGTYPAGPKRHFWVLHQGQWYMALQYDYGWQLMDATSGERMALTNPPILQARNAAPGTGLRLRHMDNDWEVILPDGGTTLLGYNGVDPTISPDGQSLVFFQDGQLVLWRPGQPAVPLMPEGDRDWNILEMVWGPTVWVTDGIATPLPHPTLVPTANAPQSQG